MGVSGSTESIDEASQNIRTQADKIIKDALDDKYIQGTRSICDSLRYTYRNKLTRLSNELLSNTVYSLGLAADPKNKQELCDKVLDFYQTKVEIAKHIKETIDSGCREMYRTILRNYDMMLEGATQKQRAEAKSRLDQLGKQIESYYRKVEELLKKIQGDITLAEMKDIYNQLSKSLKDEYIKCCELIDDMRSFVWQEKATADGRIQYYNPILDDTLSTVPTIQTNAEKRTGLNPLKKMEQHAITEELYPVDLSCTDDAERGKGMHTGDGKEEDVSQTGSRHDDRWNMCLMLVGTCCTMVPCIFFFYVIGCYSADACPWSDQSHRIIVAVAITVLGIGLCLLCTGATREREQFNRSLWEMYIRRNPNTPAAVIMREVYPNA